MRVSFSNLGTKVKKRGFLSFLTVGFCVGSIFIHFFLHWHSGRLILLNISSFGLPTWIMYFLGWNKCCIYIACRSLPVGSLSFLLLLC